MKSRNLILLGLALNLLGAFSAIAAPGDVDCETLNDSWKNQYYGDFHVEWPLESFGCPSDAARIAKAFYDLEHASLGVPGAPNFYGFVRSRIHRIVFSSKPHPNGAVATTSSSGLMTFYPPFVAGNSEAWRAATLFHEARHVDSDDPGHVTCTRGAFNGKPGSCDDYFDSSRLTELGAYNYGFYFLWFLRDRAVYTGVDRNQIVNAMGSIVFNNVNHISDEDLKRFGNGGKNIFPVMPQM